MLKKLIIIGLLSLINCLAQSGVKISGYPRATTLGANDLLISSYYNGSAYTTNKAISYANFSTQLFNSPLLVTPDIGAAIGASLDTSGDIRGNTIHGTNGFFVKDLNASVLLRLDTSKKIAPVTIGANLTFDGITLAGTGGGGGGGTSVYLNGSSVSNPNFLDSSTAIWGVSAVTNITVNPTNIANAQISASAAIPVSKLDLSGRTLTAGTGLNGGGDLSANRTFNVTTNSTQQKIWIRTGVTNNGVFDNLTIWPGSNISLAVTNGTGNTNIDLVISSTGGGGGSPGGSTGYIQYNSAGSFAGSVNFQFDSPSQLVNLGGGSDNSGESAFVISKTLTSTGNAHGFSDDTTFNRTGYAYNSLDLKITTSSGAFDHYAGVQPRATFGNSSTWNNVYLLGSSASSSLGTSGIITNFYSIYGPPIGNSGTIQNYWGLYIPNPPTVTGTAYGIQVAGGGGRFDGSANYTFNGPMVANSTAAFGNTVTLSGLSSSQTMLGVNSGKDVINITAGPGLEFGASFKQRALVTNKATSYTVLDTEPGTTFKNASGVCAFTLPASATTGTWFDFIQASNGSNLTISPGSAIMIDGSNTDFTTFTSSVRGSTCRVLWDGGRWVIIFKNGTWVAS